MFSNSKQPITLFASALIAVLTLSGSLPMLSAQGMAGGQVSLVDHPERQEVDVMVNGELFTRYWYHDDLEKTTLYPIYSSNQHLVTRGFPFIPIAGERVDHPHHVGLWFNYGNVNDIDFWNNSSAIAREIKHKYGEIRHQEIARIESMGAKAILEVKADWKNYEKETLLKEETQFTFSVDGHTRIIDRVTTLTANEDIIFHDSKEGMLGIRTARGLELPEEKAVILTDKRGRAKSRKELNNKAVVGDYISSNGKTGGDVWGTRGEWVNLFGKIDGDDVAVVMIDHPQNPNYPTFWHARSYGLFSANPLGQSQFDKTLDAFDFTLAKDDSVTFRYRVLIHDGSKISTAEIEKFKDSFVK